jgi:hypothetical protein
MIIHVVSVSTREQGYISLSQVGWNGTVYAQPTSALQHNVKHSFSWKIDMQTPRGPQHCTTEHDGFHGDGAQYLGHKILISEVREKSNAGRLHGRLDTNSGVPNIDGKNLLAIGSFTDRGWLVKQLLTTCLRRSVSNDGGQSLIPASSRERAGQSHPRAEIRSS